MSRYICREWREPRPWRDAINQLERNSRAAILDRAPPTTFADVCRTTCRPIWRGITKRSRAIVMAWRAYREEVQ